MDSTTESASADVSVLQIGKIKLGRPLNPHAASFVPTSMCRTADGKGPASKEITSRDGKTVQHQYMEDGNTDNPRSHKETVDDQHTDVEKPTNTEVSPQMVQEIHGSDDKVSQNLNAGAEKYTMVEDFEVELAYLVSQFPDVSEQSLADVYFANGGDLDASIEMLNQLEDEWGFSRSHVSKMGKQLDWVRLFESSLPSDSSTRSHSAVIGNGKG